LNLYTACWSDKYLRSLEKFGIHPGLERIRFLLERLGNPQLRFKSFHIAGTNGKGSTCAVLASILQAAGYKVGLYTSPHLFDYRERIKINGLAISRKRFREGLLLTRKISRAMIEQPTAFEVLTAVAFWYFARKKIDYAVVEVGMGGRLDATNVITPLVSIITNIDYEHRQVLGKTLRQIAGEKAGIIKAFVPVVTAEDKTEPLEVIKKICRIKNSFLLITGPHSTVKSKLAGEHQQKNAACALAALRCAAIKISRRQAVTGLRKVNWPGRFQIIVRKPLTIVDGAHNPAGMVALRKVLQAQFPEKKFTFIIGVQKDKAALKMLREIKPLARKIIFTRSSHWQAAVVVAGQKTMPIKEALALTGGVDRVVAGSLFLVADALCSIL
jgi:dihydrofolate synthase/folylpolyglutamate synthase